MDEKLARIEAVLFAYGDPLEVKKLSQATEIPLKEVSILVAELNARYSERGSALKVETLGECYQMVTRKEFAKYVKNTTEVNRSTTLSPSAMETLTIVAYNQPVTKSFVESIRGIDSSHVISTLVDRGLIVEAERLDIPGRPIAYVTTPNFLRCFGLNDISELPPLPHHNEKLPDEPEDIPLSMEY
jgi:segregation and condensation protein B